ncbi:MAG: hypothetical protein GXO76_15390 [Calditrichaeota bacterium]|nr:hypothetical protein [Calditrichota bacterium]
MPYRLKILIELQRIDSRLKKLDALYGDLPVQLENLKSDLTGKQSLLEEKRVQLEETSIRKHQAELDIKSWKGKEQKYHDQLFKVTSNREYDAIQAEIEAAKEAIDQQETAFLEASEMEEVLASEIKALEEEIAEMIKDSGELQKVLQEKMDVTKKEVSDLQKRREELVHDLDVPIYRTYERIRKGKADGMAVVPVSDNACGGCRLSIPPQKILEIRRMNKLIFCEGCGRILVWENDEEDVEKE